MVPGMSYIREIVAYNIARTVSHLDAKNDAYHIIKYTQTGSAPALSD